jgi:alpha-ketoglutarate-dependent taurine dioxygenase
MSTTEITPIDGPLGARATGVDLRQPLSPDDRQALRAALADRLLLVVAGQFLDVDAERRVAAAFGPLWEHPAARHRPGRGTAAVLDSRRAPDGGRKAEVWHADATFTATPPAYTVLSAQVVPDHGGATSFANQQLAYMLLDDAWRDRLDGLRAVHAPGPQMQRRAPWLTESVHPVVRVAAETGRRSLFVNPGFTRRFEHRTAEQSRPALAALFRVALDPSVRYDHPWNAGDLVIWDNRALLHRAHHDHGDEARVLARVTVAA